MHVEYDETTKEIIGYHNLRTNFTNPPANFVEVDEAQEGFVRDNYTYLTVDDSDSANKVIVVPADFATYKAQVDLINARTEEGKAITKYLEDYLNLKAYEYGYDGYHAAMIYKDSTVAKFQQEGQAFFDCADAIWNYFDTNKDSFAATGQPDLATVQANHPVLETYIPV